MDPATMGMIAKAGSNLLGSIFGGEEKLRQKTTTRTRDRSRQKTTPVFKFQAMRQAAEKAGLNPLTVLRSIGPAAVGSLTKNSGYVLNKSRFTSEGGGDPVGDAFGSIGDMAGAYLSYDPLDQEMKQAQAQGLQIQNALGLGQLANLGRTWSGAPTTGALSSAGNLTRDSFGNPLPALGPALAPQTALQGNTVLGYTIEPSAAFSNAEDYETRYGDIVQMIAGIGIAAADMYKGLGTWANQYSGPSVASVWTDLAKKAAAARVNQPSLRDGVGGFNAGFPTLVRPDVLSPSWPLNNPGYGPSYPTGANRPDMR